MAKITILSTLTYTESNFEEAVLRIARHGWKQIEIANMATYCLHFDAENININKTKDILNRAGVKALTMNYEVHNPDGTKPKFNIKAEAVFKENNLKKSLEKASKLGIKLVNLTPGRKNDGPDRDQETEKAAAAMNRLADYAFNLGIKTTMEVPHCWTLCCNLERVKKMYSMITSKNMGALMDSTHYHVIGYDAEEYMKILGDRLWHVHIRDAAGIDTKDFRQRLEITPGKGEVDFKKFGEILDKHNYGGEVTLELEYKGLRMNKVESEYSFAIKHLKKCGWQFPTGILSNT